MANDIGKLSWLVSANPEQFVSGLDKAIAKAEHFGTSLGKIASLPGTLGGKGIELVTAPLEGFTKPIQQALSGIPLIGGALAAIPATGEGFVKWIEDSMGEMARWGKTADKLGVNVSDMGALYVLAGHDVEAFEKSFLHMDKTLGEVRAGNKEASEAISRLGLDARAVGDMLPLDAFKAISDRLHDMPSAFDRAAAAAKIFGKGGVEALGALSKGTPGFEKARETSESLGLTFTSGSLESLREARGAVHELELGVKGLGFTLAKEVAPWVAPIVSGFEKWLESVGGLKGAVAELGKIIKPVIASFLDGLQRIFKDVEKLLKITEHPGEALGGGLWDLAKLATPEGIAFDEAKKLFSPTPGSKEAPSPEVGEALAEGATPEPAEARESWLMRQPEIRGLRDLFGSLFGKEEPKAEPSWGDMFRERSKALEEKMAEDVPRTTAPVEISDAFAKAVESMNKELDKLEETFGMGVHEAKAYELSLTAVTDAEKALAAAATERARKQDEFARDDKLFAKFAQAFESTRTPLERFEAKLKELDNLRQQGLGKDTFDRSVAQAYEELAKTTPKAQAPVLAEAGSTQAYQVLVELERAFQKPDLQQQIATTLGQIRQASERQLEQGKEIVKALKGQKTLTFD